MPAYIPDDMHRYKSLLESLSTESSVGMNPTNALSDKELDRFQQMPATKQKIANPEQQKDLDKETADREMDEEFTDEGNEFSGARKAAIDAGKDEFTVGGQTYKISGNEELSEGPADNFTIDDIKKLEGLHNLEDMKSFAKELISKPSQRPMKPQKVRWLTQAIDSKTSSNAIVKLMYDLLLGGEGHQVIGSRHSMDPNSYRKSFNEDGVEESVTTNQFEEPKSHVDHSKPDWNKTGTTSQNYSSSATKKWDSYMSNEAEDLGTTDDDYSSAEQDSWDKKGSNESIEWDDITTETARDFDEQWETEPSSSNKEASDTVISEDNPFIARIRELSGLK
jgi:hypothetical protein